MTQVTEGGRYPLENVLNFDSVLYTQTTNGDDL